METEEHRHFSHHGYPLHVGDRVKHHDRMSGPKGIICKLSIISDLPEILVNYSGQLVYQTACSAVKITDQQIPLLDARGKELIVGDLVAPAREDGQEYGVVTKMITRADGNKNIVVNWCNGFYGEFASTDFVQIPRIARSCMVDAEISQAPHRHFDVRGLPLRVGDTVRFFRDIGIGGKITILREVEEGNISKAIVMLFSTQKEQEYDCHDLVLQVPQPVPTITIFEKKD